MAKPNDRRNGRDPSTGMLTSTYTPEHKAVVIDAAKSQIMQGRTLAQIAAAADVPLPTLKLWLHSLGDEYAELRQAWLDSMLANSAEAIDAAEDPLSLARAREQWRCATWYAERRDRARYGVQAESTGQTAIQIVIER